MRETPMPKCNVCAIHKCKKWLSDCPNFREKLPFKRSLLEIAFTKNPAGAMMVLSNLGASISPSKDYPFFDIEFRGGN